MLLIVEAVQASPVLSLFVHRITPTEVGELDQDNRFLDAVGAARAVRRRGGGATPSCGPTPGARSTGCCANGAQLTVPSSLGDDLATRRAELELFLVPAICAS
ncbi:MAG: hypothetical protein R2699_12160 [Acidimicrobiales bacterium]